MQDETLISYRMAYDGIKNQDGPMEDSVTKDLLLPCRHAHTIPELPKSEKENRRGQSKREEEERSTGGASVIKEEEGET